MEAEMSVAPPGPHFPESAPPGPFLAGPPGSPLAPPPGGGTTPRPGKDGRRKWLRLPAFGAVVLLLVGVGAFFLMRSYEGSQASQSCGSYDCIPRLEAAKVVEALQDKGHTCKEDLNHRNCELRIGLVRFEVSLQVADEHIHAIDAEIFRSGSEPVTEIGLAYLNWFATLPYAGDAETATQIEAWVAEQVNGNKDTEATIGDYTYRLTNPETDSVNLHIEGNF
jgi:hypothetical protein